MTAFFYSRSPAVSPVIEEKIGAMLSALFPIAYSLLERANRRRTQQ
jgi:hypothetical protein